MPAKVVNVSDLPDLVGEDLGNSEWVLIDQARIDLFAAATNDHQWIHCDVARADRENGGTIAHGYLTLSLLPALAETMLDVRKASHIINYGLNRLRFTAPVRSGTRIRLGQKIIAVERKGEGYQVTTDSRFEAEGREQPVCIAETVMIYYGDIATAPM